MHLLPEPSFNSDSALSLCTTNMHPKRKALFENLRSSLLRAESEYINYAQHNKLHEFIFDHKIDYCISNNDIRSLYKQYFLNDNCGRSIYNHIFTLAHYNFCPYCEYGIAGELDHFLPKSIFPILSITPHNLLPSCERCNRKKLDNHSLEETKIFLHPYFESTTREEWLQTKIEQSEPYIFRYKVINPGNWSNEFYERVCFQFETLDLNTIYAAQASAWLNETIGELYKIHDACGDSALRKHLLELVENRRKIDSRSTRYRIWQLPLYKSLASDSWFCSVGVTSIYLYSR